MSQHPSNPTPPSSDAPAPAHGKPPRRSIQIAWWGWLVFFAALAVAVYVRAFNAPIEESSYYAGAFFGAIVFPLLGAWLAWVISGRGNRTVASVTLAAVSLLVPLGHMSVARMAAMQAQRQQNQQQLVDAMDQLHDDYSKALDSGEFYVAPERARQIADTLERAASGTPDAIMARAAADLLREMAQHAQPYEQAARQLMAAGGVQPAGLDTVAAIDARLKLVQEFAAANEQFDQVLAAVPAQTRARLKQAGAPDVAAEAFMRGANRNLILVREVRRTDRQLAVLMADTLGLLKSAWGAWELDRSTGSLLFERDADLNRYQQLVTQIQTVAVEQEGYQRQMLANQQHSVQELKSPPAR